jgi:hypothetical protein
MFQVFRGKMERLALLRVVCLVHNRGTPPFQAGNTAQGPKEVGHASRLSTIRLCAAGPQPRA